MDKQRLNAYIKLIEREGKATQDELMNWTASNKFITKKHLLEFTESGLLTKKGKYYYLNKEGIELWESNL